MTITAPCLRLMAQPSAYDILAEPPGLTITESPTFASKAAASFLKPCPWLTDTSPLTGSTVAAEAADAVSNAHPTANPTDSAASNPRMIPVPTVTIRCASWRPAIVLQPVATNQPYKAPACNVYIQAAVNVVTVSFLRNYVVDTTHR